MDACFRRRVLLADADEHARAELRMLLLRLGQEVVAEAGDAASALHLARSLRPDVAVLELSLPGGSGLKLLAREQLVAVVGLAAAGDLEASRRAIYAGAGAFLAKPTTEHRLLAAMELALERFRLAQQLRAEASQLRADADAERVLQRAKGLLMAGGLDADAALRRIRTLAARSGKTLHEAATAIVLAGKAYEPCPDLPPGSQPPVQ